MEIRRFLILLLISAISCSSWRPIKIASISKDGLFHQKIQKSFVSALKWIENAIQVQDSGVGCPYKYINRFVQGYKDSDNVGLVTVQTPNTVFSIAFDSPDFEKVFNSADVVVVITPLDCEQAPAALGGQAILGGEFAHVIQKIGILNYCYNEYRPEYNYYDLFRHELLHVLGYGTLSRSDITRRGVEEYQWDFENGVEESGNAERWFFKTTESATNEVKKHFECDDLNGVESDNEGSHLNEYIFFNELMTPILNEKNYFSYISAEILENVYQGKNQWYKVNRTFISSEADEYSYGKGFGCTYLKKSCYKFLDERKGSSNERPAPFCLDDSIEKCYQTADNLIPFTCLYLEYTGNFADNGIRPEDRLSKYNDINTRFCPIFTNYYKLQGYPLVDCKH